MEAGIDWITISFDGLGETYEQIRRPAKYKESVEKIANYAKIKKEAGRVKPVIKIQSVLPAIEKDPQAFYDVFAPISDMVSSNPLIDFMQSKKNMPKIENFSCPQIYQRIVIGADGLCMMCTNDEEGKVIIGDINKQTIHEVWHGEEMTRVRAIHKRCTGAAEISACAECYLPLKTYEDNVQVGAREVIAEKYDSGVKNIADLDTPERFKRENLDV
jgi:radical SAM protein with 4Fe4S-binding SPASM domain